MQAKAGAAVRQVGRPIQELLFLYANGRHMPKIISDYRSKFSVDREGVFTPSLLAMLLAEPTDRDR